MVRSIYTTDRIIDEPIISSEKGASEQEDWSFAHLTPSSTLWGPHGYHRYPAKFIPQLVRRVIDTYSVVNERVGDPFLGSATTGIEALRAGRYFYGSDIDPVAVFISKAKCTVIEPRTLSIAWDKLESKINTFPRIGRQPLTTEEIEYITSTDIARASTEVRFAYWFPIHQRNLLALILESILEFAQEDLRLFFLCAFSNILRRCSIWLSGSTKPQKDLQKILCDPVEEFRKQAQSMLNRNILYWRDLQSWANSLEEVKQRICLTQEDVRHLSLQDETLDLLVTSPPYATCYEYSEMHQLTQLWFEKYNIFSAHHPVHSYIGTKIVSRRKDAIKSADSTGTGSSCADKALLRLQDLATGKMTSDVNQEVRILRYYFLDMSHALYECARVVMRGKRMVLIVGDSYRRGIVIPTSQALCEIATGVGFELERKIIRSVPGRVLVSTRDKKTGRFSSSASSDIRVYPEEYILVFKRRV